MIAFLQKMFKNPFYFSSDLLEFCTLPRLRPVFLLQHQTMGNPHKEAHIPEFKTHLMALNKLQSSIYSLIINLQWKYRTTKKIPFLVLNITSNRHFKAQQSDLIVGIQI